MIERFAAEFRFGPPLSNNFVRARIFSERNAFVWQIRNLEKQIPRLLVEAGRALIKIDNLLANLSHFGLEIFCRFAARFFRADLLAQSIALGLQLLQLGLGFSPLRIDFQQLVDPRGVVAATGRDPYANKIRFFANQTNFANCCTRSRRPLGGAMLTFESHFPKRIGYNSCVENGSPRYQDLIASARVHDSALFLPLRTPNELELQARWFAGEFGKNFVSATGDKIDIVQFGTWNREAGPDFCDAAVRVNGSEPLRGCIEIDLVDRNWDLHGHAINPAFEETVLHVFVDKSDRQFFTRTKSNRNVPQVRVDPAVLPEAFSANIPLARPGRCQSPLKDLPEERVKSVLDAAAHFRLRRKAARIRSKIDSHGHDETLFQEIAAALGYKENKLPFTLIAQRLLLKLLRANSIDAEAMLFGIAGFLQASDLDVYERSARKYVRQLWDRWWPHRDALQRLILPAKIWRLSGTRPLNHPQRRLAALAAISEKWPAFIKSLGKMSAHAAEQFFFTLA